MLSFPARSLWADSTETRYEWLTDWIPCIGLDSIRATLSNTGISGSFQSQLAIQVAAVRPENPDAPATLGSALAGAGSSCQDISVSATTGSKFWVRFGVAYGNSTGTAFSRGEVTVTVSFNACGKVVGGKSLQLSVPSTTSEFVAVTGWIPTIQVAKIKAAISAASITGNFQWRLCYRTATVFTAVPSAWSTTFDTWRTSGDVCTGELTTTISSDMYVQIGVQFSLSSGTTPGNGALDLQVGVRT